MEASIKILLIFLSFTAFISSGEDTCVDTKALDLAFVLDISGHTCDNAEQQQQDTICNDWDTAVSLVREIIGEVNVGPSSTLVAMVVAGNKSTVSWSLSRYGGKTSLLNAIDGLQFDPRSKSLIEALALARTDVFVHGEDRPLADSVAVVITDRSLGDGKDEIQAEITNLHAADIDLFGVGLTDEVGKETWMSISSSSPSQQNGFTFLPASDFKSAEDLKSKLLELIFDCMSETKTPNPRNAQEIQEPIEQVAGSPGATGVPGRTGVYGGKGYPGAPGQTGPHGRTGIMGYRGADGSTGQTGFTGPQGYPGAPGYPGTPGAPGPTGVQGPPGPQGPAGLDGSIIPVLGDPGNTGLSGPAGYPGQPGIPGSPGLPGQPGALGDIGSTGSPGRTGPKGRTGFPGSPGGTGLFGNPGQDGPTGSSGPTGFTGPRGFTGNTGNIGAQGQNGAPGNAGNPGVIGSAGMTGYTGFTGFTGPSGSQGPMGFPGFPGSIGFVGVPGRAGSQGFVGVPGMGVPGQPGLPGFPGSQGNTGLPGAMGPSGNNGPFGATGGTGYTGASGQPGLRGDGGPKGAMGAPGLPGPDGFSGSVGNPGVIGPNGGVGYKGPPGDTGTYGRPGFPGIQGGTGSPGLPGPQGFVGFPGAAGPVGGTGASGPTGYPGLNGVPGNIGPTGYTGARGAYGQTGNTGFTGQQGFTGNPGPMGGVGAPGNIGYNGLPGLLGPPGFPGFQGMKGSDGSPGYPGNVGRTGSTGATGATGQFGERGYPGMTGKTGMVGNTGATGAQGLQGVPGARGNDGQNGFNGQTGNTGITGPTGFSGPIGPRGAPGIKGKTGPLGFDGNAGASGMPGVQGPNGIPGYPGFPGYLGATGLSGFPGINGVRGIIGQVGPPGYQGAPGPFGINGIPGAPGIPGGPGSVGFPGYTGQRGVAGYPGSLGIQGPMGATGFTGYQGRTGPQGQPGIPGSQGQIGSPGSRGKTGFTGSTGFAGWPGPRNFVPGPAGAAGPVGPGGRSGATGATGPSGIGIPGNVGQIGPAGNPGPSGRQGAPGFPGMTGRSGATGLIGPYGMIGLPGAPGNSSRGQSGATGFTGPGGSTGPTGAVGPMGPPGQSSGTSSIPSGVCPPVNECLFNNGWCSQFCIDTFESYYCSCRRGYTLLTPQQSCPSSAQCQSVQNDVVFIVDSSYSICNSTFPCYRYQRLLQLVNSLIDTLNVAGGLTRVGLMFYSDINNNIFFLNAYGDVNQIKSAVTQSTYMAKPANSLARALGSARNIYFTNANGNRPGVQNFMIVLADFVDDVPAAASEVLAASQQGIITLTVAVSRRITDGDLWTLGSYPLAPSPSYFRVADITQNYDSVVQAVSTRICKSSYASSCAGKMFDVVFAIDGYVSASDWNANKNYLVRLIGGFDLSTTRISIIQYWNGAQLLVNFNQFINDRNGLINSISNLPAPSNFRQNSDLANALNLAQTSAFTQQNGDRPDIPNIFIFIAANNYVISSSVFNRADQLKASGAFIYAFALSNSGFLASDLRLISSHPHLQYQQWAVIDFSSNSFDNMLYNYLCQPLLDVYCRNTSYGGYQCFCPLNECDRIPLGGSSCIDVNECQTNNGGCQQNCNNTDGSYSCSCTSGFIISNDKATCEDIDECALRVCTGSDVCINSYGSYYCLNPSVVLSGLTGMDVFDNTGLSQVNLMIIAVVISAAVAALLTLACALIGRYFYKKRVERSPLEEWREKSALENYCSSLRDPSFGSTKSKAMGTCNEGENTQES